MVVPKIGGSSSAGSAKVSSTGAFTLSGRTVNCTGAGPACSVARYEQAGSVPTLATLERLLGACGRRPMVSSEASEPLIDGSAAPSRLDLLRERRDRLFQAAARRGAGNVRVFGSVGRDHDRPGSDIDLLVDLSAGRTLVDLVAFRREAREILGSPVDVATPDMLKDSVRETVLAEAAPL